jgi:hypothetical protein
MTTVSIKDLFDGRFEVRVRGSEFSDIIESLKDFIPANYRSFNPDAKAWRIFEVHYLRKWLKRLEWWDDVKVEWASAKYGYRRPAEQTWRDPRAEAFKALHLLETAPPELVKAAHKTLAFLHHPDRGGDLEQMKVINAAADVILKA